MKRTTVTGTAPTASASTRRQFLRLAGSMGAAAGLVGAVAACGGDNPNRRGSTSPTTAGPAQADAGGTIRAGISYELGTTGYDPMTTTAALTVAVNWHTLEGLTEVAPTPGREVYAALAAQLPEQVDDTTYRVTLRDGAVFHDGTPVTADDVVFSFERVLDPANASLYAGFIPFVESLTADDDTTVTIRTRYPFSLVAERLATVKVVPRAAVEADPEAFDANPVGTGPYRMTDNGAGSGTVVFARFDDYTGPRPALAAAMEWQILPDASTRTNALLSRSVQAIDSVPYLSVDSLSRDASVESVQGFGLLFAMFNCGSAPFDDVRNRRAVLYAMDIPTVIETALLGNAAPATCFVDDAHPAYREASTVYVPDVERAKELLAETGLTSMRMLCTDHDWVAAATPIIRENLEAAGLSVDFTQRASADVYTTIDGRDGAFDLVLAPGDPSVFGGDADLLMRWWYSSDTWTDQRMHWKGQESYTRLQELLDGAVRETGDAQVEQWQSAFDLLSEEVPLYPLLHRRAPTGWDASGLVDFRPIALTGLCFVDVAPTA